ncbi:MAG TPA: aldo/keto reductase [Casimicrobiaceae bacterium]|nr:aldo/keto reductase [Casimicrobiaceae bacterium]
MELRNLGSSGLRVSAVGLGCNNFGARLDVEATRRVVHRALDLGITLFDTADAYGNRGGSETQLGEVLGGRRQDIVLATKFGWQMDDAGVLQGAARRYLTRAVEDSLRRLRTDWIDLYQLHKPDARTPLDETLRALDDLVRHGKVRYIGCSNFAAWQVADAHWIARELGVSRFVSVQNEYSLLVRDPEAELVPAMQHFGLGLLPYFPLAGGLLSGKYRRDATLPPASRLTDTKRSADRFLTERNWTAVERLRSLADTRGRELLDVSIAWLLSRPAVASVIAGATRPEQIDANVDAAAAKLDADELAAIDHITAPSQVG